MIETQKEATEAINKEFIDNVCEVNHKLGNKIRKLYDKGDQEAIDEILLEENFTTGYDNKDRVIWLGDEEVLRIHYN